MKLTFADRFRKNLHPKNAWYVNAYCLLCRVLPNKLTRRMMGVTSARIEYDTTSFVMFVRADGTPYRY